MTAEDAEAETCNLADWLCTPATDTDMAQVVVVIAAGEPEDEFGADAVADLIDTFSQLADEPADKISVDVEALNAHTTQINVTVRVLSDDIAGAIADELQWPLRSADVARVTLAFPVASAPRIFVSATSVPSAAPPSASSASSARAAGAIESEAALEGWTKYLGNRAVVRERSVGRVEALQSSRPLIDVSANASLNATASPFDGDDSYYRRMQRIASLHLVWVFPVIGFFIITCCAMWWCASSHVLHEERKDLYLASQSHVGRSGRVENGLLTVLDDSEVEAASTRLRQGAREARGD